MSENNKSIGQLVIVLRHGGFLPLAMTKECAYATIKDWKEHVAYGKSKFFTEASAGADDWGVSTADIVGMYFLSEIPNTSAKLAEAQTKIADAISKEYGHGEEWKGE